MIYLKFIKIFYQNLINLCDEVLQHNSQFVYKKTEKSIKLNIKKKNIYKLSLDKL